MDPQQILDRINETQAQLVLKLQCMIESMTDLHIIKDLFNETIAKSREKVLQVSSAWSTPPKIIRPSQSALQPHSLFKRSLKAVTQTCSDHKLVFSVLFSLFAIRVTHNAVRRISHKSTKRRAKKAASGARYQVIVIAGSPTEPVTKLVASDLDRRGFIVYITTRSSDEDSLVSQMSSSNIHSMSVKVTEDRSLSDAVTELRRILATPVSPFPSARPHELQLSGVILIPDLYYPTGPIETISTEAWSDLMYSKFLGPIFLLSNGFLDLLRDHNARLLLLNPCIIGSLQLPFHAPEALVYAALNSLALCLHRETQAQNLKIVQIHMGSFKSTGNTSRNRQSILESSLRADILAWPDTLRVLYALPYTSISRLQQSRSTGTDFRALTRTIYDTLTMSSPPRLLRVGQGTCLYRWALALVPECLMTKYLSLHTGDQKILHE